MCKRNVKRNYVASLQCSDGTRLISTSKVLDECATFYTDLLGSCTECSPIDESVLADGPCINDVIHIQLANDVLEDEIRGALFLIPGDKAPSPEGYSVKFFKRAWGTVGSL